MGGLGFKPDLFRKAIDHYGVWPVTVWDLNYSGKFMQALKQQIGDVCENRAGSGSLGYQSKNKKQTRKGCFSTEREDTKSVYGGKITESIFNPETAISILKLYAPKEGVVYDPFAGGGTRAIISAKFGLKYTGVEIRKEEVDAVIERCCASGVKSGEVVIYHASSTNVPHIKSESADFLITCPPYYDLEKYKGGEDDLSMLPTYEAFLDSIQAVIQESYRILKPGTTSCWVVGLHRDKNKELLCLHHDIAKLHKKAGFFHKEEVILHMKNTGAIRRVGTFEEGSHHLVRTHEYLLVFEKK